MTNALSTAEWSCTLCWSHTAVITESFSCMALTFSLSLQASASIANAFLCNGKCFDWRCDSQSQLEVILGGGRVRPEDPVYPIEGIDSSPRFSSSEAGSIASGYAIFTPLAKRSALSLFESSVAQNMTNSANASRDPKPRLLISYTKMISSPLLSSHACPANLTALFR